MGRRGMESKYEEAMSANHRCSYTKLVRRRSITCSSRLHLRVSVSTGIPLSSGSNKLTLLEPGFSFRVACLGSGEAQCEQVT